MSLDKDDPGRILEQDAIETKTKKKHRIKMMGIHLCGFGVFSNVYKGKLILSHRNKAIAIKKSFPESKKNNKPKFVTKLLSLEGPRPHKNIIHMLYYFSNTLPCGSVCDDTFSDAVDKTDLTFAEMDELGRQEKQDRKREKAPSQGRSHLMDEEEIQRPA